METFKKPFQQSANNFTHKISISSSANSSLIQRPLPSLCTQKKKTSCVHCFNAAKGLEHLADEPDCLANNRVDDFNRPKGLFYSPQ